MTRQVPTGGAVFLDHTGHFIPAEAAAREALQALGFTVTPFSAQVIPDPVTGEPTLTGTGNICVMLPEGYLEFLLHTADTEIGREFRAALDRRAGLHLAAFSVADAAHRHAELQASGHAMRPLVHFSRQVETAEGSETAAFTVARLLRGAMPEGRVQVLTHHTPDAMWQPHWTAHANGAVALRAILVSSPDPDETAERFSRFLDRPSEVWGRGRRIALDRGAVEILPEAEATTLAGQPVEPGLSVFAGLRIAVKDPGAFGGEAIADGAFALPFDPALGRGFWLFEAA